MPNSRCVKLYPIVPWKRLSPRITQSCVVTRHKRPLGFHACPYLCKALKQWKCHSKRKNSHKIILEASRYPSLESLVRLTRYISRLWATNVCGKNFDFRRLCSYLGQQFSYQTSTHPNDMLTAGSLSYTLRHLELYWGASMGRVKEDFLMEIQNQHK